MLGNCCTVRLLCDLYGRRNEKSTFLWLSLICGLINIQCVGSSALPVSMTCCPLSQAKKKNMSIPDGVRDCESVDMGKVYIMFLSTLGN